MDKRLEFYFDENLREVSKDPAALRGHANDLEKLLKSTFEPRKCVSLLGELGSHLRVLGDLQEAEEKILSALQIIKDNSLEICLEVQQKIRLAHVHQWQKKFELSNRLFAEVIATCRSNGDANLYLDFALQHSGKNLFDQRRFSEALDAFEETMILRVQRKAPKDQIESTAQAIRTAKQLRSK